MTYQLSSINTVLLPQFQPYTDQYGLITDNNLGNSTGNGNLYTAYYVFGLFYNNILDKEKQRLNQVYLNNFIKSGLYTRSPSFPGDRESQDDAFGIMFADALLNPETRDFTKAIYNYGETNDCDGIDPLDKSTTTNKIAYYSLKVLGLGKIRQVWNNITPNTFSVSSWLGRFLNLKATMQMASKEPVNVFAWAYWALWIFSSYLSNNNGAYCLKWCSAMAVEGYGPITNFICKIMYNKINKEYGSISGLMESYFANSNNPLIGFVDGIKFF